MSETPHSYTEPTISAELEPHQSKAFPRTVMAVSREEFYGQDSKHEPLQLTVKKGQTDEVVDLPADLHGHVFIIAAVGSVDSKKVDSKKVDSPETLNFQETESIVLPSADGWTSLFNGDGMIYRLDFHQTPKTPHQGIAGQECPVKEEIGKAWLATQIVKPPCYYVDAILHEKSDPNKEDPYRHLRQYKFENLGFARYSSLFGARNQLNTAFLPIKFSNSAERLLVTWDVGRPYEINPCSLKLVAPVGWNTEWDEMIKLGANIQGVLPFQPLMASAHPVFDANTEEMFTVNVLKSLSGLAWPLRLPIPYSGKLAEFLENDPIKRRIKQLLLYLFLTIVFSFLEVLSPLKGRIKQLLHLFLTIVSSFLEVLSPLFEPILRWFRFDWGHDAVYLVRWDGVGSLKKWQVFLPNGRPLKIRQSLHQMGLTENYVVLSDSSFKLVVENFLSHWLRRLWKEREKLATQNNREDSISKLEGITSYIRYYLTFPQSPHTNIYLVPRENLNPKENSVKALPVTIPREMAHFLVDYEDYGGKKVTIHAAHICASDPAEFIHIVDKSVYDDLKITSNPDDWHKITKEVQELAGIGCAPMDLNLLGCHVIDITDKKPNLSSQQYVSDINYTWAIALYAYRDDKPTKQFKDIYWGCWGSWKELLTDFIYDLYANYKNRVVPAEKVRDEIAKNGIPANLCRVHIEREENANQSPKMTLHSDLYPFPSGYFGNSPQFVPRKDAVSSIDGYIVCVVSHSDHFHPNYSHGTDNGEAWSNNSELWVFDAENLKQGPLYRLSHPKLKFGLTIHTSWLSQLASPPVGDYDVRKDYQDWVKQMLREKPKDSEEEKKGKQQLKKEINNLFNEVYSRLQSD